MAARTCGGPANQGRPGGGGRAGEGKSGRGVEVGCGVRGARPPRRYCFVVRARRHLAARGRAVASSDTRDAVESFPKVVTRETLFTKTDLNVQNIAFKISFT